MQWHKKTSPKSLATWSSLLISDTMFFSGFSGQPNNPGQLKKPT
jgi:hypothetical protein